MNANHESQVTICIDKKYLYYDIHKHIMLQFKEETNLPTMLSNIRNITYACQRDSEEHVTYITGSWARV